MLRLLKIEWNKLYYYQSARVFIIIYFILMVLMGCFISLFSPDMNGLNINFAKLGAFSFPYVWQNITYFAAIGKFFLAVIIITNITNEYSNRTLKQNLIDGLSKKEFVGSKLLTNLVFAVFSTLVVAIICLGLGSYYTEKSGVGIQGIEFIVAYLLKLIFFFSFCMFLAFLLKKTAFSLVLLFVWWVLEKMIGGIEGLFRFKLLEQDHQLSSKMIYAYLPLESSSNLIKFPQMSIENYMRGGSPFIQGTVDWIFCISTFIYTLVFIYLSYLLVKKRDL